MNYSARGFGRSCGAPGSRTSPGCDQGWIPLLFGNGWRFRRGHEARLELVGRDPSFLRTSNFRFSVRISNIRVQLPGR